MGVTSGLMAVVYPWIALFVGFTALANASSIPTIEIAKGVHMPMMVVGGENCSFPDIAQYGSLSFNCTAAKCSHYPSPMPVSGHYTAEMARRFLALDLEMLGSEIGYIDLLLLHEPCNMTGAHNYAECAAIYGVLEEALQNGTVRSIGVDQFSVDDLERLKTTWKVKPAVNMMPITLGELDQAAWDWCKREGIAAYSYSALHSPCLHDSRKQELVLDVGHGNLRLCSHQHRDVDLDCTKVQERPTCLRSLRRLHV